MAWRNADKNLRGFPHIQFVLSPNDAKNRIDRGRRRSQTVHDEPRRQTQEVLQLHLWESLLGYCGTAPRSYGNRQRYG